MTSSKKDNNKRTTLIPVNDKRNTKLKRTSFAPEPKIAQNGTA